MSDEPRIGRTRNLAWGLAAVTLTFVAVPVLAGVGTSVLVELREAGALDPFTRNLLPQAEPLFPDVVVKGTLLLSVFGSWLSAGVLVGRRERWRVALLAGAVSAALFMGFAFATESSVRGLGKALAFGLVPVAAGLTAAGLCAVRRRWRC